ncbi:MAG: TetR family transcriptional regulator [Alphaproteobacteria bacterium]|nr:TetR family transcriptional regulator [Alphaproteobacteria bacterium]
MPKKAPKKSKASGPSDPIDAALALAAEIGWRKVTLGAVAERSGVALGALLERYPSKTALLIGFQRRLDQAVLAGIDPALGDRPAQERLFDVVMRRLDALTPHKAAISSIVRSGAYDLDALVCGGMSGRRSLSLMLEAAGLSSSGPKGALRREGLALIYLDTIRVWLRDDSADMAATMKTLDTHLRRIARLIDRVKLWRGRAGAWGSKSEGSAPS